MFLVILSLVHLSGYSLILTCSMYQNVERIVLDHADYGACMALIAEKISAGFLVCCV